MSDLKKRFIQIGEFAPDSRFMSGANLKQAESMLPVYGSYRPSPQMQVMERDYPIGTPGNGLDGKTASAIYVHLSSESIGNEFAHVTDTAFVNETYPKAFAEPEPSQLMDILGGISFDDSKYVYFVHSDIGVWQIVQPEIQTTNAVTLDVGNSSNMRIRFRAVGSDIGDWTVRVEWGRSFPGWVADASPVDFVRNGESSNWEHQVISVLNADITTGTHLLSMRISVKFDTVATTTLAVIEASTDDAWTVFGSADPEIDGLGDADDLTGFESPALKAGETSQFQMKLDAVPDKMIEKTGHSFMVRALGEVAGMALTTEVHTREEPDDELVLVSSKDHSTITTGFVDYDHLLTEPEADEITNYSEVYLTAKITGVDGTTNQRVDPSADLLNQDNYWESKTGDVIDLFEDVDKDTGDTEYIETPNDAVMGKVVRFTVPAASDPETNNNIYVWYRLKSSAGGSANERLQVTLKQGGTTLLNKSGVALSANFSNRKLTLTDVNAAKVDWSQAFQLTFQRSQGTACKITLAWAALVTPAVGVKAQIAAAEVDYPSNAQVQFSWLENEYSIAGEYLPGNQPRIMIGAESRLYEVLPEEIVKLNKTATEYVEGNAGEKSWHFTSWGNMVVATNYADPVQALRYKTAIFEDLIDMTDTAYTDKGGVSPRCRFVGVVGSQLIMADIDENSYVDGRPYTVWHSAMSIPGEFYPVDYATQSTFAQILSTPGGITGFIGGERGTIFKMNSIFRMTYVGYPPIYKYDLISKAQGTPYPRSIVAVDQDIYFMGNGGIFRLTRDNQLQQLGVGKVEKYLFDSRFEDWSLNQFISYIDTENDALVQGAYDAHSGLIYWAYSTKNDPKKNCSRILVYSPKEDRFSIISGSNLIGTGYFPGPPPPQQGGYIDPAYQIVHPYAPNIAAIAGAGNVIAPETSIVKGFHMVSPANSDLGDAQGHYQRFTSGSTMPIILVTERMSASGIAEVNEGINIEIHDMRPIVRIDGDETPNIVLQVYASETPSVIDNYQFRSSGPESRNSDGWLSLGKPITGEFFYFVVHIAEMSNATIKEFLGIQIRYRVAGDY